MVKQPRQHLDCEHCGRAMPEHLRAHARYCSTSCRRAVQTAREGGAHLVSSALRICAFSGCDADLNPLGVKASGRYCGPQHRNAAYRERKAAQALERKAARAAARERARQRREQEEAAAEARRSKRRAQYARRVDVRKRREAAELEEREHERAELETLRAEVRLLRRALAGRGPRPQTDLLGGALRRRLP